MIQTMLNDLTYIMRILNPTEREKKFKEWTGKHLHIISSVTLVRLKDVLASHERPEAMMKRASERNMIEIVRGLDRCFLEQRTKTKEGEEVKTSLIVFKP